MIMPIVMTAQFQVRSEGLEMARQTIREFVDYVRENEPRTRLYTSNHEKEEATRFLHFFVFEDQAAMLAHRESEGVQRFTSVLYPLLVADVTFTEYEQLATTER
jgi:quinol monooxygenase YgiN